MNEYEGLAALPFLGIPIMPEGGIIPCLNDENPNAAPSKQLVGRSNRPRDAFRLETTPFTSLKL
jgi:hypothetical protein